MQLILSSTCVFYYDINCFNLVRQISWDLFIVIILLSSAWSYQYVGLLWRHLKKMTSMMTNFDLKMMKMLSWLVSDLLIWDAYFAFCLTPQVREDIVLKFNCWSIAVSFELIKSFVKRELTFVTLYTLLH